MSTNNYFDSYVKRMEDEFTESSEQASLSSISTLLTSNDDKSTVSKSKRKPRVSNRTMGVLGGSDKKWLGDQSNDLFKDDTTLSISPSPTHIEESTSLMLDGEPVSDDDLVLSTDVSESLTLVSSTHELIQLITSSAFRAELLFLLTTGVAVIIGLLADHLIDLVDLMFLGHLGQQQLASAALAVLYCNVTGVSLVLGLMSAVETLVSQAFGSRNFKRMGLLFQRSLVMVTAEMLLLLVFRIWCNPILTFLGTDANIVPDACTFIYIHTLGMPAMCYLYTLRQYLLSQCITKPPMYNTLLGVSLTPVFNYIFVFSLGYGAVGVAISYVVVSWVMLFALVAHFYYSNLYKQTWHGVEPEALSIMGAREFLSFGIPGIGMVCAEWWGLEFQTFISGKQGTSVLGSQSILFNLTLFIFTIPMGLSIASAARIGRLLGESKPYTARLCALVSALLSFTVQIFIALTLYLCSGILGEIFTSEPSVLEAFHLAMPFMCVYSIFDGYQGVMAGVMRGIGMQKVGFVINLIAYWAIALPVAYYLSMRYDWHIDIDAKYKYDLQIWVNGWGVEGQWVALIITVFLVSLSMSAVLSFHNWERKTTEVVE